MRLRRWAFLAATAFALLSAPCAAEVSVLAGVNRDTVTVGEPLTFRVRIRHAPKDQVEVIPGDDFPGVFEVRGRRPPSVHALKDGQVEETRDFTLSVYQTGSFQVPAVAVRFRTASGDTGRVETHPVPVVVRSVMPKGMKNIRGVKSPVEIPGRIPAWAWGVLAALLLAVAALVWYLKHRKRKPRVEPPPPPVDWRLELEKIAGMGLLEKGEYKRYYTLLSELTRRYLEARTGVEAMERTTFEVVRDLRRTPAKEAHVAQVEALLSEADLVKFAKFLPDESTAAAAVERVRGVMAGMGMKSPVSGDGAPEADSTPGAAG